LARHQETSTCFSYSWARRALDARSGDTLWSTRLPNPVQGTVVAYSVGGDQYLAVPTGNNSGFYGLTPEIPRPSDAPALFVFRLRDRTPAAGSGG